MAKFDVAKAGEVANWLRESACKKAEGYIPPHRVMRMRWVLTWKQSGPAKARIVIVGFEDPDLLSLSTTSPTMSRRTRQLMLIYAATMHWPLLKGDVKSAFLQGNPSQESRDVYAWPVQELASAMGVSSNQPVRISKACYGLVNAPAEWHRSVVSSMVEAGFTVLETEPCCWRLSEQDEQGQEVVVGLAAAHVDDFLFCGDEENEKYRKALHYLFDKFVWSPWESGDFDHCGVQIRQSATREFVLDQSRFCEKLEQVDIEKLDNRKEDSPATESEKAQLRGLLGGIQWRAQQTAPQHSAQLSMLQSDLSKATLKTLKEANKLCREVYHQKHVCLRVNALPVTHPKDVIFVCWTDAALGNRPNGGSTGGYVLMAAPPELADGQATTLNLVAWRSSRLTRIARSSLAAEVQGFSEGEEELMYTRLQWAEMCGCSIPLRQPESVVQSVRGIMVTDARSLYDVIQKGDQATSGLGLREKYSALEIMSVLQRLKLCQTQTRWVHSGAQLADALTKRLTSSSSQEVLSTNKWTLVDDPSFTSCKKLKRQNLGDFRQ